MIRPTARAALLACALSTAARAQTPPQAQPGSSLPSVRLWGGYELSDPTGNLWGSAQSVVTLCPNTSGTGQGFAQVCPGSSASNPLYTSAAPGSPGAGSSAPSGTPGTATTTGSPVFDATTGKGLLTAGTALPAGTNALGSVTVNLGTQATPDVVSPASGATFAVSATALPLPAGAATSTAQAPVTSAGTTAASAGAMQGVAGGVAMPVSGSVAVSTLPSLPAGTNGIGTVAQGAPGPAANPWPVSTPADRANDAGTTRNQTHDDQLGALAVLNRVVLTQGQVSVPASTSTLLLSANANRKSLRISGTNAADSFRLGYGVAASATSSALFGSGGVFTAEQYGPGDGVPTGAIYGYSTAGFTAQVGEGN